MAKTSSIRILREACEVLGYQCQDVLLKGGVSVKVSDGKQFFYAGLGIDYTVYPMVDYTVQRMLRSKWMTKQFIADLGIEPIPGQIFRIDDTGQNAMPHILDAPEVLPDSLFPAVWKPDVGQRGQDVFFIKNRQELQKRVDLFMLSKTYKKVLIDQYIDAPEYRIFYALGKVYYLHRQLRPAVIGDGESSLEQLIDQLDINDSESVKSQTFSFLELSPEKIIPAQQRVKLIGASNRVQGGGFADYSDQPPPYIQGWVKKICEAASIKICGFDVFIRHYGGRKMQIMPIEINPNPGLMAIYLQGYQEMTVQIWKDILEAYFNQ